ncbi:MAG: ammonium transporter, partial [Pseudomonadota bacterium]
GGIAAGIFGQEALGGMGGVSLIAQIVGTLAGVGLALVGGFAIYGALKAMIGIRLDPEEEFRGSDLAIHSVGAYPEEDVTRR